MIFKPMTWFWINLICGAIDVALYAIDKSLGRANAATFDILMVCVCLGCAWINLEKARDK